jgi:hypothetical protein
MTPRSIRRAQERKAQKLARKEARPLTAASGASLSPAPLDRTHPKPGSALEAKRKASAEALRTVLADRATLLPSDDVAAYQTHVEHYIEEFQPAGIRESNLVLAIAEAEWRLLRLPVLEHSLFQHGRRQFAEKVLAEPPARQSALLELETFLFYEKQLRGLQLQQARLRRQRDQDLADLATLQQERNQLERERLSDAATLYTAARHDGRPWHPSDHGFEFSIEDIQGFLEGARAAHIFHKTYSGTRSQAAADHS